MIAQQDKVAKSRPANPWTRGEKWLLALILIAMVGSIGIWGFMKELEQMPVLKIPIRAEPSVNGYASLVAASRIAFEGPGLSTKPADPQLAAHPEQWLVQPPAVDIAANQSVAIHNVPALVLLHKAFKLPIMTPHQSSQKDWAEIRGLSRSIRNTASVQASLGHYDTAMNTALDGAELGERIIGGGGAMDLIIGNLCQSINRRAAWPMLAHVDSKTAREAAQRAASIDRHATPISEILNEEKWSRQRWLMETFEKENWRTELFAASAPNGEADPAQVRSLAFTSKRALLNSYTKRMDAMIGYTRGPFRANANPPSTGVSYLDGSIGADAVDTWFLWCQKSTDMRLFATALALRAYWLDHGSYPASLDALAPKYLPSVPQDPFGSGPLKYKVNGNSYKLYSIGPDGKDDGGKPIMSTRPHYQFNAERTSSGDIVAGLNE